MPNSRSVSMNDDSDVVKADVGVDDPSIVFDVLDDVHHHVDDDVNEEERLTDNFEPDFEQQKAQKAAAKNRFFRQLMEKILDSITSESVINDTMVSCGGSEALGPFRIPSLLMASISPVFRSVAASYDVDQHCVIMPDIDGRDLE